MNACEQIRALEQSTDELVRAAQAGDWIAAEQILSRREDQISALREALRGRCIAGEQAQLQEIERSAAVASRILLARRETMRAEIAALEAERRSLASWTPQQQDAPQRLDLTG